MILYFIFEDLILYLLRIVIKTIETDTNIQDGVIVLHQALIEDAAIPSGLMVPSMSALRSNEDVIRLAPASSGLAEFALKVRQTNVFLTGVSSLIRSASNSSIKENNYV